MRIFATIATFTAVGGYFVALHWLTRPSASDAGTRIDVKGPPKPGGR